MKRNRWDYNRTHRDYAVRRVIQEGIKPDAVAAELGCGAQSVRTWLKEAGYRPVQTWVKP